jgi:hypothetical protein
MIIKSARLRNTAISIIKEFNKKKINYGLGRNYEQYPNFGHDIDFYSSEDVRKLKKVLVVVAKKNGWDFLTHDIHFNGFLSRVSSIDIFHFYKYKFGKYEVLHLDFFRSSLIYGLPFIKSSNIKMIKNKKKFFTIDKKTENTIKLLQLKSHFSNKHIFHEKYVKRKIDLYKKKIINFTNKDKYKNIITKNNLFFENEAIESLRANQIQNFKFYINASRYLYLFKYIIFNPVSFICYFFSRIATLTNLFILKPPGSIINFYLTDKKQKKNIYKTLNLLKSKNFFDNWTIKKNNFLLSIEERKILERNGVIVSFNSDIKNGSILIKKNYDLNKIVSLLVLKLVKKNSIIYQRK